MLPIRNRLTQHQPGCCQCKYLLYLFTEMHNHTANQSRKKQNCVSVPSTVQLLPDTVHYRLNTSAITYLIVRLYVLDCIDWLYWFWSYSFYYFIFSYFCCKYVNKRSVFSSVFSSIQPRLRFHFVYPFVSRINYTKTTQPIFTKFGGKVARGLRKKPLDFGGNPAPGIFLTEFLPLLAKAILCTGGLGLTNSTYTWVTARISLLHIESFMIYK